MHKPIIESRDFAPPKPDSEILPGVVWGRPEWVPSPAYWHALYRRQTLDTSLFSQPVSLVEEISFCLLGGYGITAEMNCAAFLRLKENGIFQGSVPTSPQIEGLLREPLLVGASRSRYRFPAQRSARLAAALKRLSSSPPQDGDPQELRRYLLLFDGIGPKTASWIVRNWLNSDDVAIIDIHVLRACRSIGLFPRESSLPRDYFTLEASFLRFAKAIHIPASSLDVLIWSTMRKLGNPGPASKQRRVRWVAAEGEAARA